MEYHILQASAAVVALVVEINGVPLVSIKPDARETTRVLQINQWLTPGPNEVRVRIDWPVDQPFRPDVARARVKIVRGAAGGAIDESPQLVKFEWPTDAPGRREGYPFGTQLKFTADPVPATRFWAEAEPIALSPDQRSAILAVINRLETSLAKRDIDGAMTQLAFRVSELGLSAGIEPANAQEGQRSMIEGMLQSPGSAFVVHAPDEVRLQLVADGRLVWATLENQQPLIQLEQAGTRRPFLPIYIGRIGGQWTIVR